LLRALDREPVVARLVFVEALGAGRRVLARRARALEGLAGVVDRGRENPQAPVGLPGLVAEGVVGATFGVVHARLLELRPEPLIGLLGGLMAMIVLPYRGGAAAARELECRVPRVPVRRRGGGGVLVLGPVVDYRLSVRTRLALAAVAGRPGLNNNEVSEIIGLEDKSQVSRILKRLSDQGLVEDVMAQSRRQVRAWRLTADGEVLLDTHRGGRALVRAQREAGRGGKLVSARSARRGQSRIAAVGAEPVGTGFRVTVLTHEVLAAIADLGREGSGPSNREVALAAGVKDQAQISRLLARLLDHGLLENVAGRVGRGNAWRLTGRGEELLHASQLKESSR
jgi:DNA-binding MarR family transcriptional regulator